MSGAAIDPAYVARQVSAATSRMAWMSAWVAGRIETNFALFRVPPMTG